VDAFSFVKYLLQESIFANRFTSLQMKLSIISAVIPLLAQLVAAAPTPTWDENEVVERAQIVKRATITDIATTGYATQDGG
jgi:pectate lyase